MIIFVSFTDKLINIICNMKEKILAALKAKFQGSNANVLNRIAEKLAKTVTTDEQVTTVVAGVTQELIEVMESYGDSRATEATQTATQNYETKYGLKDGKPISGGTEQQGGTGVTTTAEQTGGTETVPAWAQQLIESNKTLSERLNKMDGERTTATRKQQLSAVYQKLPENLRKPYERISVDALSDDEFTTLVGEVTTEVDGLVQSLGAKGAVFGRPAAHNGGTNQGDTLTKEQEAAIGIREGKASEDGQPF